jgi:hypothetical protein
MVLRCPAPTHLHRGVFMPRERRLDFCIGLHHRSAQCRKAT